MKSRILHVYDHCVKAAARCIESGYSAPAIEQMQNRFREVAREVSLWELGGAIKAGIFLRPMEEEFVDRFGPLVGREIYRDFVEAFWLQSWTTVPLEPSKLGRPLSTPKFRTHLVPHYRGSSRLSFDRDGFTREAYRD